MAGHTSRNRMDCVLDGCAVCSKFVCNLLDKVLCLSDCHTVAGDDNDLFCSEKSVGIKLCLFFLLRSRCHCCGLVHVCEEGLERFCSVAKIHMDAFFTSIERIVHACIAGFCIVVEDEDVFAVADIEDGHTVDRSAFCGVSSRVQDVVCANNDGCIC